jgi:hypothetical protein
MNETRGIKEHVPGVLGWDFIESDYVQFVQMNETREHQGACAWRPWLGFHRVRLCSVYRKLIWPVWLTGSY